MARKKFLRRVAKAAVAAGAAYAGSKYLASQKPGWGVNKDFTDMDKNVGKTKEWITKRNISDNPILPKKKPIQKNILQKAKEFFSSNTGEAEGLNKSNILWADDNSLISPSKGGYINSYDNGGEIVIGKNIDKDLL